jgi:hypothetical protein
MATFPAVDGYKNEEDVEEDILNRPILALKERTEFLRERLENLAGQQAFESVRLTDVELNTDEPPALYDFVFVENGNTFAKALAASSQDFLTPYQMAEDSAFAVGIITDISGAGKGTVVLYGKLDIPSSIDINDLVESGESFRSGPYYLSTTEKGKITATPKGPAVYLGFIINDITDTSTSATIMLAPQYKDLWQAHSHFKFVLSDNVAGRHVRTGTDVDDAHSIASFQTDTPNNLGCFILGGYTRDDGGVTPTYTLTLEGSDFDDMVLKWSTDDGSDDGLEGQSDPKYGTNTGVRITSFYRPVNFGSYGLQFVLHADLDPLNMPVSATQPWTPPLTAVAAERTWTLQLPEAAKGWLPRMHYAAGVSTSGDFPFAIFSYNYDNTQKEIAPTFSLEVVAAGDVDTGGPFPDVEVFDSTGGSLAVLSAIEANSLIPIADGLFLYTPLFDTDGNATVSALSLGETWDFTLSDRVPQSLFEYALDMDRSLTAYYPPSPVSSVVMEINGLTMSQRNEFDTDKGLYTPDPYTLYWFDDTFGRVPWNRDIQFEVTPDERFDADVALYMTKMALSTAGLVNSLKVEEGAPLTIVDCKTGLPATTGDLLIKAAFNFSILDGNLNGFKTVKGVDSEGNFLTGPVVEKLVAGPNILIQGDPSAPGQGTVRVSAIIEGSNRGQFHDVSLLNAKYERLRNRLFSFLKLLTWDSQSDSNVETGFTMQFRVPDYLTSNYKVSLYLTAFGLADVAAGGANDGVKYAGLNFSYNIIPDLTTVNGAGVFTFVGRNLIDAGASGILEGSVDADLLLGAEGSDYTAYDPILVTSDPSISPVAGQVVLPGGLAQFPFPGGDIQHVTAGDVITIKISRRSPVTSIGVTPVAGTDYEYIDEIGFLNLDWKLTDVGVV